MRFQGELSTLSFVLHFNKQEVLLNGTLWPRRPPSREPRPEPLRLQFSTLFTETQLLSIQHWLTTAMLEPFPLSGNVSQISRAVSSDKSSIYFDLEFRFDQVPDWWDWPISFPLSARLEIRPNEFTYLTESLSRQQWSTDLTW